MNEMAKFATPLIATASKTEIVFQKLLTSFLYRKRRNVKSVNFWWSKQCVFVATNTKASPVGGLFENIYCILKKASGSLPFDLLLLMWLWILCDPTYGWNLMEDFSQEQKPLSNSAVPELQGWSLGKNNQTTKTTSKQFPPKLF